MSTSSAHAAAFYSEVAKAGVVWGISDAGGFPAPVGSDGMRAMPFWSSESRAQMVISNVAAYKGFTPTPIKWSIFCDRWIPGLIRDRLLVGINWAGVTASGFDVVATELQRNVEALKK